MFSLGRCLLVSAIALSVPYTAFAQPKGDAGSGPTNGATSTNDAGSGPTPRSEAEYRFRRFNWDHHGPKLANKLVTRDAEVSADHRRRRHEAEARRCSGKEDSAVGSLAGLRDRPSFLSLIGLHCHRECLTRGSRLLNGVSDGSAHFGLTAAISVDRMFATGKSGFRAGGRISGAIAADLAKLPCRFPLPAPGAETFALTAIAYLQPVTRGRFRSWRGGRSDVIAALERHGLIDGAIRAPQPACRLRMSPRGHSWRRSASPPCATCPDLERLRPKACAKRTGGRISTALSGSWMQKPTTHSATTTRSWMMSKDFRINASSPPIYQKLDRAVSRWRAMVDDVFGDRPGVVKVTAVRRLVGHTPSFR